MGGFARIPNTFASQFKNEITRESVLLDEFSYFRMKRPSAVRKLSGGRFFLQTTFRSFQGPLLSLSRFLCTQNPIWHCCRASPGFLEEVFELLSSGLSITEGDGWLLWAAWLSSQIEFFFTPSTSSFGAFSSFDLFSSRSLTGT